jgi:hypothetical protein
MVAEGVMALRDFPIDQLPNYIRTRAINTISRITDTATSMQQDVDSVLLTYAKSELIDPDEKSEERARAREEYMEGQKAIYPGKAFRPGRRKRGG